MKSLSKFITFSFIFISLIACTSTHTTLTAANDEDDDSGIGGTGMLANRNKSIDSGIGGSGMLPSRNEDDDNGLGGTGILGKITGFGSVFVNGIEVEYDDETKFTINGKPADKQQLQIGDVVEVLTQDNKAHTWARIINLRHEVIGKVESADPHTYSFKVNGQTIIQLINNSKLPEVGIRVAVSGFRVNEKTIISSRVTPVRVISSGTEKDLLRTHTELPFRNNSTRWLVQMHVRDKTIFHLDNSTHVISNPAITSEEKNTEQKTLLNIRILKLQKTQSGELKLQEAINPVDIPLGKASIKTPQFDKPFHNPGEGYPLWNRTKTHTDMGTGTGTGSGSGKNPATNRKRH